MLDSELNPTNEITAMILDATKNKIEFLVV